MAVAFEIRMCSKRNAPTGMIPVRECSLRSTNDIPRPARKGATPRARTGAEELADATEAPYEPQYDKRTLDYLAREEGKSRNRASTGCQQWGIENEKYGD